MPNLKLSQIHKNTIFLLTNTGLKSSNALIQIHRTSLQPTFTCFCREIANKDQTELLKKKVSYGAKVADLRLTDWNNK